MMSCDRCPHQAHMGPCEAPVIVQGVETDCTCFTVAGMTVSQRVLRHADAAQQRAIKELVITNGRKPFVLEDVGVPGPETVTAVDIDRIGLPPVIADEAAPDGLLPWERGDE